MREQLIQLTITGYRKATETEQVLDEGYILPTQCTIGVTVS